MNDNLLTIFYTYGKSHQVSKLLEEVGEFIETVMNEDKENIACNWKDSCLENAGKIEELENQQKEFIKYMNSCIKELEKGSHNKLQNTINLGIIDVTKTILQKYKSIIGDDK